MHLALVVPDPGASAVDMPVASSCLGEIQLERRKFEELVTVMSAKGEKVVSYYSGPEELGSAIEVVPGTEARQQYLAAMEALARAWGGSTQPIRRYKTRADFLAAQGATALDLSV